MRPITIPGRMALEYDAAFIEWLNSFEERKTSTNPRVLVMNEIIAHVSIFNVFSSVRESIED